MDNININFIFDENFLNCTNVDDLFKVKLAAFEIKEIRDSSNNELKSMIRKATSGFEVMLYSMMVLQDSLATKLEPVS